MSVDENLAAPEEKVQVGGGGRRAAFDGCFSGLELAMEAGPLKELDPEKLKNEIKRWAKAVVAYARQLSFGAQLETSEGS
ncbi:hypothetical protein Cni_G07941 [Canna indica]|uniref:Uncharacterized protein n=1 Tax=Canna indica TaxID=4628 RepID=A0AAQ3JZE6_9LILI|nr:hypothetical protein Cni_G07941 [Canna indica]